MNMTLITGRLARWLLLMHEFDITIMDKPGKVNVVADFLSRVTTLEDTKVIDDTFPDEHLLFINMHTPGFFRYNKLFGYGEGASSLLSKREEDSH